MIDVTSIAVIAVLSSAQQQFRALEQHPVGAPKLAPAESLRLKFADPGTGGGGSGVEVAKITAKQRQTVTYPTYLAWLRAVSAALPRTSPQTSWSVP